MESIDAPDITAKEWAEAKRHFDVVRQHYLDLDGLPGVLVLPALNLTFAPLARRYNRGERTRELFDAMMQVE